MRRALLAVAALGGLALAAAWHGGAALDAPADLIVTCTACHDGTLIVLPR